MEWLDKKECAKTYKDLGVDWTDRMACTYNKGKTTLCSVSILYYKLKQRISKLNIMFHIYWDQI